MMAGLVDGKMAAWLQVIVSRRREQAGLYREIARQLPLENAQRVLDVGTGTGLQLKAIHDVHPGIELFGLDLSEAAVQAAQKALAGIQVDLRPGSIHSTDYGDDYFDIVTCHSSLSYWIDPQGCINEIYRILKPGGKALIFEPQREIDMEAALDQIRDVMRAKGPIRRWGAVQLHKFALKRGSRVGLNLYSIPEFRELIQASSFGDHQDIAETSLLGIPIFARILLWK